MKFILRVSLVLLAVTVMPSNAIHGLRFGGPGPVPVCPYDGCGPGLHSTL